MLTHRNNCFSISESREIRLEPGQKGVASNLLRVAPPHRLRITIRNESRTKNIVWVLFKNGIQVIDSVLPPIEYFTDVVEELEVGNYQLILFSVHPDSTGVGRMESI